MTVTCVSDQLLPQHEPERSPERVPGRPSILVAVASYGSGQEHFLKRVIAEYQRLDTPCRIVVLSNVDKPVQGAEVIVGLPSRDSYSLPFAHRKVFRENVNNYDLFIYTEDDTLLTARNIRAFLEIQQYLEDDEILGFVRSETDPSGACYIVSANCHFRWLPDTVITRGPHRFAQFSNQHSGCYIASRKQLANAIASGGFTLTPRTGRYGMLETAASDIYTQCGLTRVVCLTQIEDFIVPHLANKYHGRMGVPQRDFDAQVKCALRLADSKESVGSLFDPETRVPGFRWSKHLYWGPDKELLGLVPFAARRILSIGAASGADEIELLQRGHEVSAVPVDPIFGDGLERRGVRVYPLPLEQAVRALGPVKFEVVLVTDVLHLLADPLAWLRTMAEMLVPDGKIVGSVSNTTSLLWAFKDWRRGQRRWVRPNFDKNGVQPMSERRLAGLCRASGLESVEVIPSGEGPPALCRFPANLLRSKLAPWLLFRAGRKG